MSTDNLTIGQKISKYRKIRKLTQKELADRAQVTTAAIQSYELEKRYPKIETLLKIAQALDVPIAVLKSDIELFTDDALKQLTQISEKIILSLQDEKSLIEDFRKLNLYGRIEAKKQISNLTKIKEYTEEHTTD